MIIGEGLFLNGINRQHTHSNKEEGVHHLCLFFSKISKSTENGHSPLSASHPKIVTLTTPTLNTHAHGEDEIKNWRELAISGMKQ